MPNTNTTAPRTPKGDAARAVHAAYAHIADAAAWCGIGRSRLYEHAAAGRVRFVKDGGRTLCDMGSLRALLAALPDAPLHPTDR